MAELNCIGAAGEKSTFELALPETTGAWKVVFRVYENSRRLGDWFELRLVPFDNAMSVEWIGQQPKLVWAAAKGIPDALLPLAARHVEMDIYSSKIEKEGDDYLVPEAAKVWQRLVACGLAEYIASLHRFVLRHTRT